MKTTDLIPIILYQLKDGDRYGYEIIKQIEDLSEGKIIIKQPTLYSVLKKLEQNRFITSYWQDSEIGGKRHYYKLTDNGILQLSTYPALQQLITDALDEDILVSTNSEPIGDFLSEYDILNEQESPIESVTESTTEDKIDSIINPIKIDLTSPTGLVNDNVEVKSNTKFDVNTLSHEETKSINIFDMIEPNNISTSSPVSIFDAIEPENSKTKYTSIFDVIDEGDSVENFDTITENNDTLADKNTNIITTENIKEETCIPTTIEPIVTTEPEVEPLEVKTKLSDKVDINPDVFVNADEDLSTQEEIFNDEGYSPIEQIEYLNYVDLTTDEKSVNRRKMVSKQIQKMAFTCTTLILMLILTSILCYKYSFGKIYYVCAIVSVLTIILYPIIMLRDVSKLRLKYCTNPFRYSLFPDLFIKLSTFISLICITLAYNIGITHSITDMLQLTNFANLYAPIIFASIFVFDLVFSMILYKDYRTKK